MEARNVVWITGGAGFIGSHLASRLAGIGRPVVVIDCLTDYYDVHQKRLNLQQLSRIPNVSFSNRNLSGLDFAELPLPATVFHLAGQPGVRSSWGPGFKDYIERNIVATERLANHCARVDATIVYASSSSVYGILPTGQIADESTATVPYSPYGITKLAGELLVRAYSANHGLRSTCLRYFTVYGPRQRPDMAIYRLCEAALDGSVFPLYGDGTQVREFTYVDDVVRATVRAANSASQDSPVFNVAGGSVVSMKEVIAIVERMSGQKIQIDERGWATGDVPATRAATVAATDVLGWRPEVSLDDGIGCQLSWHRTRRGQSAATGAHVLTYLSP